jgi:hypothetical protein
MPSRSSPPRLRPCIAELLRTCVHSNSLPLRLEKVVIQTLNHSTNKEENRDGSSASKKEEELQREFYRLWLSDGEFMIQAVLERRLHHTFFTEGPAVGSLLDIKRFRVRRGKRIHGPGEVIYLAIADYEIVPGADPAPSTETYDLANEGGFIREESQSLNKNIRLGSQLPQSLPHPPSPETMLFAPSSQDSDDFETADVELKVLDRRRQTLHELSSSTRPSAPWNSPRDQSPRKRRKLLQEKQPTGISPPRRNTCVGSADVDGEKVANSTPSSSTSLQQAGPDRPLTTQKQSRPVQPFSITDTRIPTAPATPSSPPLHTLSSLLHPQTHSPLPSRNYTCAVFAIVSWCSPNLTFPRHAQSPFPPKRHVKIHDPSIASRYAGITLAVYDRARTFEPRVGTVALFVGVVMQRWEGEVILNAYAKKGNRENGGGGTECGERAWYVDDEERLVGMGHNVIGMRDWWAERSQGNGPKAKKG